MFRGMKVFGVVFAVLLPLLVPALGAEEGGKNYVWIPEKLTTELKVQAAFNGEEILWRFEWPADPGFFYHDMLRFQDGKWERHGSSVVGRQKDGIYEDRLTFLVDQGAVPGFANQGCFAACHNGMRFLNDTLDKATVKDHPYLGKTRGKSDLRKYIPASRNGEEWWQAPWDDVKAPAALKALAERGVFLDLWHWRAHRGNPIGYADDQYVLEYRNSDSGRGPYTTNFDKKTKQPKFMFDAGKTGFAALSWDKLLGREYPQDGVYYLSEGNSVPFDPNRDWKNGDVIPRRLLRTPQGSHGTITARGRWADGVWHLELRRAMDPGFPTNDHALLEGRTYNIGFAIHANATGSRWHYISYPVRVGIGTPGKITAVRFSGDRPDWAAIPTVTLPMWYPAQITWEWLTGDVHPGAAEIKADSRQCISCHGGEAKDVLQLSLASVHHETPGVPTRPNWWLTLVTVVVVLVGATVGVMKISRR